MMGYLINPYGARIVVAKSHPYIYAIANSVLLHQGGELILVIVGKVVLT